MADKYTTYPPNLQKRIDKANKMIEGSEEYRKWWNSLSEEERARIEALQPEERSKEIERLFSNPDPNPNPPVVDPPPPPDPDNPAPSPEPETIETLKAELEKAEQRYRTLQGMMKDTGEQEHQINVLLGQIKMLQDQIHEKTAKKPEEKKPEKINVREKFKARYDRLAEHLAPEALEEEIQKDQEIFDLAQEVADQKISEVAGRFDSNFAQSAKDRFDQALTDWGDWQTMWRTPEFQAFLDEEDGISGYKRFAILDGAFKRCDSRTVLRAFNYFAEKTGKKGPRENLPAIDPDKVKNRISPARPSGPINPVNPGNNKNQMSPQAARKALVALSSAYTRGQFRGSKEEYDKEYNRLFNLCREGTG